jgi:YegS/Rv2252/BmrU family lipid kinase
MRAHTLIIINQVAARARRVWPRIQEMLAQHNIRFDAHETTHPGDATERARAALADGYRLIAAVGGDGTLGEVAAGFFAPCDETWADHLPALINAEAAMAILPAGTGDDFARGLEGWRAPLDRWLERFIAYARSGRAEAARPVDVICGRVSNARQFICLNAVTMGIGAEVTARVARQNGLMRRLPGEARFALAAAQALAAWRERAARVQIDSETVCECPTNVIAISNGPFAGSGMKFAPEARPDDGALDLIMACGLGRAAIVRELARIRHGGHLANPRVRTARGAQVRVEPSGPQDALLVEADGDVRGYTPAELRVMPRALRIVF